MTIVFQGHVKSADIANAPPGKLAVTLVTPMAECQGREWTIYVPESDWAGWAPGWPVSFTLYTLKPQDDHQEVRARVYTNAEIHAIVRSEFDRLRAEEEERQRAFSTPAA